MAEFYIQVEVRQAMPQSFEPAVLSLLTPLASIVLNVQAAFSYNCHKFSVQKPVSSVISLTASTFAHQPVCCDCTKEAAVGLAVRTVTCAVQTPKS